MISYIKGKVIQSDESSVIVENSGIGYEIYLCESLIATLQKGEIYEFFIYSSYTMYDGFRLYGFTDRKQLEIFKLLQGSIPNTGAKKALEYLNKILKSISDFKKAITTQDTKLLKNMFGFTPKTSEKIIMALKDKMDKFETGKEEKYKAAAYSLYYDTALNALISLGYKASESKDAINSVIDENKDRSLTAEDIIKLSLKKISTGK